MRKLFLKASPEFNLMLLRIAYDRDKGYAIPYQQQYMINKFKVKYHAHIFYQILRKFDISNLLFITYDVVYCVHSE